MTADVFESTTSGTPTTPVEDEQPVAAPAAPGPQPEAVEAPEPPKTPVAVAPSTVVRATLEALLSKAKKHDEFAVELPQPGSDEPLSVSFLAEAVTGPDYDKLVSKCPPTREQAARGAAYDAEDFEPLLMSECVVEPKMTKAEWAKVRKDPNWSGGEWASLFLRVQALCMAGLNVPFS